MSLYASRSARNVIYLARAEGEYLNERSAQDSLVGKMTLAITKGDWLTLNVLYTSLTAFWTYSAEDMEQCTSQHHRCSPFQDCMAAR